MKHNLALLRNMLRLGEAVVESGLLATRPKLLETVKQFRPYVQQVEAYERNARDYPKSASRPTPCSCRPGGHCNVECNL